MSEHNDTMPLEEEVNEERNATDVFFEELFDRHNLHCLFADAVVKVGERGIENDTGIDLHPVTYCAEVEKKFSDYRENFNQTSVRESFLLDTTKTESETHTLELRVKRNEPLDLVGDIPIGCIKGWKRPKVHGIEYRIPMIETRYLQRYHDVFSRIVEILLDKLEANLALRYKNLNRDKTRTVFFNMSKNACIGFARDDIRIQLNARILTVMMLERIMIGDDIATAKLLVLGQPCDDEITAGMFIRIDASASFDNKTMIQQDSVGMELKINYNLTLDQMRNILRYMFSKNINTRMEAKVKLLSSVKGDIRNDIALDCEKVLLHVIREYYMTRPEIMDLIFSYFDTQSKMQRRCCISCGTSITNGTIIRHVKCQVVEWLIDKFGFCYEDDTLSIPPYMYVKPGIANYIRQAFNTQVRTQTKPFVSKTHDELSVYKIGPTGLPVKMAHQGIKTVRFDGPTTSTGRR